MVTFTGHIISVLRLVRWPNLVIVAVTQVLIRQCIMSPILRGANMEVMLTPFLFTLLVLSTVFITAGGYAINDYFDRKIDTINKPGSMVVGTQIYPRHAMAWHLFFTITGVILGTFVALKTHQAYLSLVFFMVSGLLWFYSTTYKRELLLGNIIIALLTALVPFIVLLFEMPLLADEYGPPFRDLNKYITIWVAGFSVFAFLLNLTREIVKDAQDYKGDLLYGKNTIPVAWGTKAARYLSIAILIATIGLLIMVWYVYIRNAVSLIYFCVLIVIPLLFVIYNLRKDTDGAGYRKINTVLKLVMISGLGYAVIANLILNYLMK